MKSKKGGQFEREIAKKLSLWWSKNERDDLFWRSQASGARATVRNKAGKTTAGQYGDIASTDPSSKSLTDLFTIELKRGYSKDTFADVMDLPLHNKQSTFEGFIEQCIEESKLAKTPYWMLIFKRNSRRPLIFIPSQAFLDIVIYSRSYFKPPRPHVNMKVLVKSSKNKEVSNVVSMSCMQLDGFLDSIASDDFKIIYKKIKNRKKQNG